MDTAPIIARVAELVHRPAADAAVIGAVDAAAQYVATYENVVDPTGDPDVALIPDSPLVEQGMVGFSRALYLDAFASRGAQVALGDTTVDTVFTPEDLYRHWRHYFAHLATLWGIA